MGKRGEDEACRFLSCSGYVIIKRNWRYSHLEIDIISLKDNVLHFVEVKSRTAPYMVSPELNVTKMKQRKLINAANAFINSQDRRQIPQNLEIVFDVLTVIFDREKVEIDFYPQAFVPIYA